MVIETDGQLYPLEIKRAATPVLELIGAFGVLDKASYCEVRARSSVCDRNC